MTSFSMRKTKQMLRRRFVRTLYFKNSVPDDKGLGDPEQCDSRPTLAFEKKEKSFGRLQLTDMLNILPTACTF